MARTGLGGRSLAHRHRAIREIVAMKTASEDGRCRQRVGLVCQVLMDRFVERLTSDTQGERLIGERMEAPFLFIATYFFKWQRSSKGIGESWPRIPTGCSPPGSSAR